MKNLDLLRRLNRLKTMELLSEKVVCTVKINIFKLIELAMLGITGSFAAYAMPKVYDETMVWDAKAIGFLIIVVYTASLALIARYNHGYQLGMKELIIDLLAFRMNRTGKSGSAKRRKTATKVDKPDKSE